MFKTKTPNKVPLKREISTFFEYKAKKIASSEGSKERAESSMARTLLQEELSQAFQTSLCIVHTLFHQPL